MSMATHSNIHTWRIPRTERTLEGYEVIEITQSWTQPSDLAYMHTSIYLETRKEENVLFLKIRFILER